MKLRVFQLFCFNSFGAALLVVHAFLLKRQFYPSVIYLTKSPFTIATLYTDGALSVVLIGKFLIKIFFKELKVAEVEYLIDNLWANCMETCVALAVFGGERSPIFMMRYAMLFIMKCSHLLTDSRLETMERLLQLPKYFHVRLIGCLLSNACVDTFLLMWSCKRIQVSGYSVEMVFAFEYAILFVMTLSSVFRYALSAIELHQANQWNEKAVYSSYAELVIEFLKLTLYTCFAGMLVKIYWYPIFIIRPLVRTVKRFKGTAVKFWNSRTATRNLEYYPNATKEELENGDNICVVCREEMDSEVETKKLMCGHIFHFICLKSWFQRQQLCPTCRASIIQMASSQAT